MPNHEEITTIAVKGDLRSCPACGYDRGFHVSFAGTGPGRDTPVRSTREIFRVILVCPECGARFDAGWRVPLNETGERVAQAEAPAVCVPHGSPAACLPAPEHHDRQIP